jgi:hypothetical protein
MERMKAFRNIAIVVAIAAFAYVAFGTGGGRVGETVQAALIVGFAVAIGFIGIRLFREHRISLHSLGDRHRGMLYGGLALAVFVYAARRRMWETGIGEFVWFVLLAIVVYALLEVFRYSRTY